MERYRFSHFLPIMVSLVISCLPRNWFKVLYWHEVLPSRVSCGSGTNTKRECLCQRGLAPKSDL
jgi:hypothetical protein